jgi:hypothetical protein
MMTLTIDEIDGCLVFASKSPSKFMDIHPALRWMVLVVGRSMFPRPPPLGERNIIAFPYPLVN